MIVAQQKQIDEIISSVRGYKKLVVAGCGTCVSVSLSGGSKEATKIAAVIRLFMQSNDEEMHVSVSTPIRQCDIEFLDSSEDELINADCILSLACGAGVQFMAEKFPHTVVVPGLNTQFIGVNRDLGYWTEMCQGCGSCILEKTGGICPVSRCSKSIFNGPCGGSANGKCEINQDTDCGWQLIYDRLSRINQAHRLLEINDVRDWSTARDGGPRSLRRDDVIL